MICVHILRTGSTQIHAYTAKIDIVQLSKNYQHSYQTTRVTQRGYTRVTCTEHLASPYSVADSFVSSGSEHNVGTIYVCEINLFVLFLEV
jgi:predicted GNAT superfamily acetyltransferase